jgi:hypothetical protein
VIVVMMLVGRVVHRRVSWRQRPLLPLSAFKGVGKRPSLGSARLAHLMRKNSGGAAP